MYLEGFVYAITDDEEFDYVMLSQTFESHVPVNNPRHLLPVYCCLGIESCCSEFPFEIRFEVQFV